MFCFVRLKNESIVAEIKRKVQAHPTAVCHVPQALKYLVTTETLLNDAHEVRLLFLTVLKLSLLI